MSYRVTWPVRPGGRQIIGKTPYATFDAAQVNADFNNAHYGVALGIEHTVVLVDDAPAADQAGSSGQVDPGLTNQRRGARPVRHD